MKPEKVFVRYKNFNESGPHPRERNEKRPYEKKKYAEKSNKTREAFKIVYESFTHIAQQPSRIKKLCQSFTTFFNPEAK